MCAAESPVHIIRRPVLLDVGLGEVGETPRVVAPQRMGLERDHLISDSPSRNQGIEGQTAVEVSRVLN